MACYSCIVSISSCSKDESSKSDAEIISSRSSNGCDDQISSARIEFGKILSKSMVEDVQLTNYIKSKMTLEYNSLYSFLYIKERYNIVYSGKTFEELLMNASGQPKSVFDDIVCRDPLLTISMSDREGVSVYDWTSGIPGIAAIKECNDVKYVLYNNANPFGVELTNDPTSPTINIISSEIYYLVKPNGYTSKNTKIDSYMPSGPSISTIVNCANFVNAVSNTQEDTYSICGNSFKLFEHDVILQMYVDCFNLNVPIPPDGGGGGGSGGGPSGGGSSGGDPCDKPCSRDCESLDEALVKYRILNWQVYKSIANKFWEVDFVFHGKILAARDYSNGSAVPHSALYVSPIRKRGHLLHCDGVCFGKWQTANYRIWTDWDLSNFGSPYYIDWSEEDSSTQTVGISFPIVAKFKIGPIEFSAGVTHSISQTSATTVALGNAPIFYCDPILKTNATGSLEFQVN